ncbi:MAG: hydrolase [Candidatus Sumerlaeota bacterium]|nr:hydrolase [Candidatus Sumerlaeota bacterium]
MDSLDWIDSQRERMIRLLEEWAAINSYSYNLEGLAALRAAMARELRRLPGALAEIELPPSRAIGPDGASSALPLGKAFSLRKDTGAARRALLGGHMDTVYPPGQERPRLERVDEKTLRGPGVADMKGGLVVMLVALEAFERSPFAAHMDWEVLLNPDEEIGSPGSTPLLAECARRNRLGLIFEPALPDGGLVAARKGSGSFTAVARGRAAHAGRNPQEGRNAIHALAEFIVELTGLEQPNGGTTINVGRIEGGGAVNVVPDLAIGRFNVRAETVDEQRRVEEGVEALRRRIDAREGFSLDIHGGFQAPPKRLDERTRVLLEHATECGRDLGLSLPWGSSGGVSDGNRLAAAGLPTLDSLGVVGVALHSPDEYMLVDSLTERARLAALLLMKLGAGEIDPP